MNVYCYPASDNSKYIPLLFVGTPDRYTPIYRQEGTLAGAIDDLEAGRSVIVHIHWEEFVLDECETDAEADAAADAFTSEIASIRRLGGPLLWTVHNELPHEIVFHRQFLRMRAALAHEVDVILLHDLTSLSVLRHQVDVDLSKIRTLRHPSYLDVHEDAEALRAGLDAPPERRIQGFGWIRRQKGFGEMIEMLPPSFLDPRGLSIRISGHGPQAGAVMAQQADRDDIDWDVRHVPDAEVPRLLRSALCVVLPYQRTLTSGVALLAMSVGGLVVAVDTPTMRELLPSPSHQFLFRLDEPAALQDVVDRVLELSPGQRRRVLEANLSVARAAHPRVTSGKLADLYDDVRSNRVPGRRS